MTILHPITPQMVSDYKAVRLRALSDSPSAFGSTYLKESQLTDEEWNARAGNLNGERAVGYLAFDGSEYCGIAACFLDERDLRKADLVSMWVAPESRRSGAGRLLVDAIARWAAGKGAQHLYLMVTGGNDAAMEFYRRIGFSMTGHTEPYPNDPALMEYEMVKAMFSSSGWLASCDSDASETA
jgi:ribosomal protein S18 acetylase RimI-like enzyme